MFHSFDEMLAAAKSDKPLWEVIRDEDCREEAISPEESFRKMKATYRVMRETDKAYDPAAKSASGLVGTDAGKLEKYLASGQRLAGGFMGLVMVRALRTAESNACMKRIVAAPTAGSCGVIPAVFLTAEEELHKTEDEMTGALYVAAAIGGIIACRASLAGASGGCQAEIGSASAMAAGALTYLEGGTAEMVRDATAMALSGLLGLVCDPVAGLVEVPCVKRNVIGAVNAVTSSEMALAGIQSRIPADEVIDAMKSVGSMMHGDLRESGIGGLAGTPTGREIREKLAGDGK
ncbi:MAG: L-serine ammonia-lyase, iron-sulfur-dependent, subunit alpha [Eubacteriales bacterium]|jgi:L-serine dehydratase|nr:L-serine ammonia-lyase, iron-sulfur-dependent, subunit alpha [Lachnospiraceae bacterium]MDD5860187.1 L-serine ammonia-lyase, iron-sulfur-dependent, subunit alpha [Eubacteriales bacterium]MCI1334487.1 L-serine ammonia-lyase, iron-sulfur-dependent, subunit alpha [Lachnospiraceae bacterium]MCI1358742.1 L-serine ammonia-lyase, iron-sulfur-dependent, subunit alpha [Lachnospiraceae bacterium]MCI1379362.1 L-serine ammonia-lyase, iron-sulfur-dependent, subunit alpha [Lachnospiraceae bacterium]